MRNPKFIPDQKLFYRHVVEDDKLYTSRVIEYLATTVKSSRYDKKTDTFYYKITHPIHQVPPRDHQHHPRKLQSLRKSASEESASLALFINFSRK